MVGGLGLGLPRPKRRLLCLLLRVHAGLSRAPRTRQRLEGPAGPGNRARTGRAGDLEDRSGRRERCGCCARVSVLLLSSWPALSIDRRVSLEMPLGVAPPLSNPPLCSPGSCRGLILSKRPTLLQFGVESIDEHISGVRSSAT